MIVIRFPDGDAKRRALGYLAGRFDILSQRVIEVLIAIPGLYVVIILAALILTFGVVILIGLLSGVYPSWKAGRVRPLEAIRSQVE